MWKKCEKNENIQYINIIKIRPDVNLLETIDLNLKLESLYIPFDSKIDINKLKYRQDNYICDIIAYGNVEIMNLYFEFKIEHMLQWGTPHDLEIYNEWSKYFSSIIKPQHNIIDNSTLILPMAGYGSRFSKKGNINPKPLIDVNGLPMIIQAVNCLPTTYKKIFICLNDHLRFYDLDKILLNSYSNTSIYSINKVTQGQACTCQIGITNSELDMNTSILISACDNGVYYDVNKYQALLDNNEIDVIVWSFRNNSASKTNPNMYAWLEVDENDYVKSVSCKNFDKSKHDIKNSHVIIGTMYFRKAVYFLDGLQQNYNENKKQMMNFM